MTERNAFTLGSSLWAVAFTTLGLAAFLSAPDSRGVLGLAFVGHVLNLIAVVIDRPGAATPASLLARRFTITTLAVGLAGEGVGSVFLFWLGERELALWFLLGLTFSAAGIATTIRRVPGDHVFACQLFFHGTFLFPIVAATLASLIASSTVDLEGGRPLGIVAMSMAVLVFRTVWVPLLFVALVAVLAYDLTRPRAERALCWEVLLGHQAAFVVIVFRWAANGL